jgi:hypothetical protein
MGKGGCYVASLGVSFFICLWLCKYNLQENCLILEWYSWQEIYNFYECTIEVLNVKQ